MTNSKHIQSINFSLLMGVSEDVLDRYLAVTSEIDIMLFNYEIGSCDGRDRCISDKCKEQITYFYHVLEVGVPTALKEIEAIVKNFCLTKHTTIQVSKESFKAPKGFALALKKDKVRKWSITKRKKGNLNKAPYVKAKKLSTRGT